MDLGPFGFAIEGEPGDVHLAAAADIEKLGFTTLWIAGGQLDRLGFTETDIGSLSDRLVDELVTWGSPTDIAAKAHEHRAAGADHVQLTVLHSGDQPASTEAARQLAPLLFQGNS